MAQKSAENLVQGVQQSVAIPFERVLFGLGIRYVGETVAKKLAKHYKTIAALSQATEEDLIGVDEIGGRIAESVILFFAKAEHQRIVERLKHYGVQLEIGAETLANQSDTLAGKTFVVSGVFEMPRNDLKKLIEQHGGKVGSSISAKISFLIAGDKMGPSKKEKAEKLNIMILSEEDFLSLIT